MTYSRFSRYGRDTLSVPEWSNGMTGFRCLGVLLMGMSVAALGQTPSQPISATSGQTAPAPAANGQTPAANVQPPAGDGQQPAAGTHQPATSGQSTAASGQAEDVATKYAGPMDATRYIIGPQDTLAITVWKEPTLSGTFPVRPDGMISLVLLGDLVAAGQTPMALSTDIATRLKKYVQDPVVTVVVQAVNSQRIFLVGEVGHVGPIQLTPGMTPLQAIVSAGGLSPFANSKKIYILRTVNGKQQKIPFAYKAAVKGTDEGVTLLPGDTIIVP